MVLKIDAVETNDKLAHVGGGAQLANSLIEEREPRQLRLSMLTGFRRRLVFDEQCRSARRRWLEVVAPLEPESRATAKAGVISAACAETAEEGWISVDGQ